MAQHLGHEERVARGAALQRPRGVHRRAVELLAGRVTGQLGDRLGLQPGEVDARDVGLAMQVGQQLDQRMLVVELGRAERRDDRQPQPQVGGDEVAQEQQRRRVGPLDVVQEQDHRALGLLGVEQPDGRAEEQVALGVAVGRGAARARRAAGGSARRRGGRARRRARRRGAPGPRRRRARPDATAPRRTADRASAGPRRSDPAGPWRRGHGRRRPARAPAATCRCPAHRRAGSPGGRRGRRAPAAAPGARAPAPGRRTPRAARPPAARAAARPARAADPSGSRPRHRARRGGAAPRSADSSLSRSCSQTPSSTRIWPAPASAQRRSSRPGSHRGGDAQHAGDRGRAVVGLDPLLELDGAERRGAGVGERDPQRVAVLAHVGGGVGHGHHGLQQRELAPARLRTAREGGGELDRVVLRYAVWVSHAPGSVTGRPTPAS